MTADERREHQAIRLDDGRLLSFAEYGDSSGEAVLLCHREVGSRLLGQVLDHEAARRGLRVVCPDRPGIGLSDFQTARSISDWPADLAALADILGLEHFAVVGGAGGTPYVLASARALEAQVRVAVVAGAALPPRMEELAGSSPRLPRLIAGAARRAPGTVRVAMGVMEKAARRSPEKLLSRMEASAGEADRAALGRHEIRHALARSIHETFRSGARGAAHDLRLLGTDWSLGLESVPVPVTFYHGGRDTEVALDRVRELAAILPSATIVTVDDGGHHLLLSHPGTVLDAVTG